MVDLILFKEPKIKMYISGYRYIKYLKIYSNLDNKKEKCNLDIMLKIVMFSLKLS